MKFKYLVGGCAILLAQAAAAQAPAQTILSSPGEIRSCLCLERFVSTERSELGQQRQNYMQRRNALASLNQQVESQRRLVDTSNPAAIAAFKQLLQQRDAADIDFNGDVTNRYTAAVQRYNAVTQSYNQQCSGRIYAPDVLAQVRSGPFDCPRPN